jgi:hypothetical protein
MENVANICRAKRKPKEFQNPPLLPRNGMQNPARHLTTIMGQQCIRSLSNAENKLNLTAGGGISVAGFRAKWQESRSSTLKNGRRVTGACRTRAVQYSSSPVVWGPRPGPAPVLPTASSCSQNLQSSLTRGFTFQLSKDSSSSSSLLVLVARVGCVFWPPTASGAL